MQHVHHKHGTCSMYTTSITRATGSAPGLPRPRACQSWDAARTTSGTGRASTGGAIGTAKVAGGSQPDRSLFPVLLRRERLWRHAHSRSHPRRRRRRCMPRGWRSLRPHWSPPCFPASARSTVPHPVITVHGAPGLRTVFDSLSIQGGSIGRSEPTGCPSPASATSAKACRSGSAW